MWFRRRGVSSKVDVRALRSHLEEAALWCMEGLDAERGFCGSSFLLPRGEAEIREEAASGRATPRFTPTKPDERLCQAPYALVASIVAARARRLTELAISAAIPSDELVRSGRVLCCGVNASLDDRACHVESRGFLDEDCLPPIGTWFGVIPLKFPNLLAWVPERHVDDVDAAMPCCPTEAYEWLTDTDPVLERALLRGR